MGMTLKEAADYITTHARQMEAVQILAEMAREPEKLEARVRELQSVIDNKKLDLATADGLVEKAKANFNETVAAAERVEGEAIATLGAARIDAEVIVATAKNEAKGIKEQARSEAKQIADAETKKLEDTRLALATTEAALQEVIASTEAKAIELTDLDERIARARAFLRDLAKDN